MSIISSNSSRGVDRLLVFIVAYNAETTIRDVLTRIPADLNRLFEVEVLIIDDASHDLTFETGLLVRAEETLPFPLRVLYNPVNQGYGGNQKLGFHYAIEKGFDYVALLHGDGQYRPEALPELMEPLRKGEADAVFGSRMMTPGGARKGGMPLYKYIGNKILTTFENRMLGSNLSEFHSGYRIYSTEALKAIPFPLNTRDFHFDTEIIIQLLRAEKRIVELPIPTYYGEEICYVNGMRYAWDVFVTTLIAAVQRLNIYYARKFDCRPDSSSVQRYQEKSSFPSPHQLAYERVPEGARVVDLGCAGGEIASWIRREKRAHVTGVDVGAPSPDLELDAYHQQDLNDAETPLPLAGADVITLLDVIEHLNDPEGFVERLRHTADLKEDVTLLVSTGNVAFGITRLSLLFGSFNYGKSGILDLTHTRLFTFKSLRRLFRQAGYDVVEEIGVPAPFPLALDHKWASSLLLRLNQWGIKLWKSFFSFQMFMVIRPRPTLEMLTKRSKSSSALRSAKVLNGQSTAETDK
ncbi:MAG: glycosyltransferase [Magnetococcales bacterium]|nr:glycosyltransferase [Magnetococcales bacterium]